MKRMMAGGLVPLVVLIGAWIAMPAAAQAGVGIELSFGGPTPPPPPPPVRVVAAYPPPGPGAVWIQPHYEWHRDRWVLIEGYYDYPPAPGAVWVVGHPEPVYWHSHPYHRWVGGHWDYRR